MLGPLLIILVVVVVIPVGFLMSMSVVAAILGYFLRTNAESIHAASELLDTNH